MIELPGVTLCCVDTRHPELALDAMRRCMDGIRFGAALLFSARARVPQAPAGVRVVDAVVESAAAYSHFMLKGLAPHVAAGSHVLVVQWDGFVVDPAAWDPAFLEFDYIGARWHDVPAERSVGNGGFSLRSRRLLAALQDARVVPEHPEDVCICRTRRDLLEREHGIRFAPPALADRFAFERLAPAQPTFGFHGLMNLHRVLPAAELRAYLEAMPDDLARNLDAHDLCTALIGAGRLDAAALLIAKRRRLGMRDRRTLRLRWRLALARWRAA